MEDGDGQLRQRIRSAQALSDAIGACDPRDAVLILAAALEDLNGPAPSPAFVDAREEAALWADAATVIELEACFTAALPRLRDEPQTRNAKKRVFMALWRSFADSDQEGFLRRVGTLPACYGDEKEGQTHEPV
ncbi:hypothetical protein QCN27_20185 [Cereibacter sp. SYSU M97828]|nr:hypothetical protein [Cereibacter flavus]